MNSSTSKSSCDHVSKKSRSSSTKSDKIHRTPTPKRVISSKKLPNHGEGTSYSAGVISKPKLATKPKKATKSEQIITKKTSIQRIDFCKHCGDGTTTRTNNTRPKTVETDEEIQTMIGMMNEKCVKNDNTVKVIKKPKSVQQYYKNENFQLSTESVPDPDDTTRKISLDTIREVPEIHNEDSIFRLYSESEDESEQNERIDGLKEFRKKNYFECHSATSRIKTKLSATSLGVHRCVYRFYLNDRLFPVPLNADYNNRIRCVECHLPMDEKHEGEGKSINGTIQAKVKLGAGKAQDMVLLLPVKDTLIIKEKRNESKKVDEEVVYFGVIKLSTDGNSVFNSTLPYDSLALRYQKGYTEYREDDSYSYSYTEYREDDSYSYSYKHVDDDDIIVI